jgi:hypothetical protein
MSSTQWFQQENLYKCISYMHATVSYYLQETRPGKSLKWIEALHVDKRLCDSKDRPIGGGREHNQPTY